MLKRKNKSALQKIMCYFVSWACVRSPASLNEEKYLDTFYNCQPVYLKWLLIISVIGKVSQKIKDVIYVVFI